MLFFFRKLLILEGIAASVKLKQHKGDYLPVLHCRRKQVIASPVAGPEAAEQTKMSTNADPTGWIKLRRIAFWGEIAPWLVSALKMCAADFSVPGTSLPQTARKHYNEGQSLTILVTVNPDNRIFGIPKMLFVSPQ